MHGDYGEICCHSSTTVYCSFEAYSSGVVPHSFPQKQWFYWPALHPEIGEWRKRGSGARSTAKLERHGRLKCFTVLERQDTVYCRAKMVYCGAKARSTVLRLSILVLRHGHCCIAKTWSTAVAGRAGSLGKRKDTQSNKCLASVGTANVVRHGVKKIAGKAPFFAKANIQHHGKAVWNGKMQWFGRVVATIRSTAVHCMESRVWVIPY